MIFDEINNLDYNGIDMLTFLTKLLSYCTKHKGLFDFTKTLSNGKSLFTTITKTNFPNIKDIVNLLVENGVDPNEPDKFNVYPLEHAIIINYFEFFIALLNLKQINCDQKFQMSENTAKLCSENLNKFIYKDLFAISKSITYLHLAVVSSNSNILMEFINRKLIDVNVTDDNGNTPLIYACRMQSIENIKILMNIDNIDFLHRNQYGHDAICMFHEKNKR